MSRRASRSLLAAVLLCTSVWAWADAVTDRAKSLLQRNDPVAAYKLLLPLEPQRAGDPEFDYLLGISALDAGDPERAIFALERVLAVQPENLQARAEIARAYLATGEREAAKREFEAVRARQVPPQVRSTIDGYRPALQEALKYVTKSPVGAKEGEDATPGWTPAMVAEFYSATRNRNLFQKFGDCPKAKTLDERPCEKCGQPIELCRGSFAHALCRDDAELWASSPEPGCDADGLYPGALTLEGWHAFEDRLRRFGVEPAT